MSLGPPPTKTPFLDPKTGLMTPAWAGWYRNLYTLLQSVPQKSIQRAPLTPGGNQGVDTYTNGILTNSVPPT